MNDDEKRLLLALAACVLSDRVPGGPERETQVRVLRHLMEPFKEFLTADEKKMREANARKPQQ